MKTELKDKTQKEIILEYLLRGKDLTGSQALIFFGVMRLSSIISLLKKDGLIIKRRRKKKLVGKGTFVVYSL